MPRPPWRELPQRLGSRKRTCFAGMSEGTEVVLDLLELRRVMSASVPTVAKP